MAHLANLLGVSACFHSPRPSVELGRGLGDGSQVSTGAAQTRQWADVQILALLALNSPHPGDQLFARSVRPMSEPTRGVLAPSTRSRPIM
jgi:hypothetical protein